MASDKVMNINVIKHELTREINLTATTATTRKTINGRITQGFFFDWR